MEFEGRRVVISWLELPYIPPRELTTQSYGICFTAKNEIVLVSYDGIYWNLPGGQLFPGESLEEGLSREVMEEACATVIAHEYIGCQRVEDPEHANPEQRFHYQARFWTRVELHDWAPKFEIIERRLVSPEQFTAALTWGAAPTALRILQLGLESERRYPRSSEVESSGD
jgi:ADP-ribose pyrophosphatase YjhB (NUDIX family)